MPPWLLSRGLRLMDKRLHWEAWYVYICKALVAKAREVGRCKTALPIILGAKEYKIYLAAMTGSTNLINNDELIETPRKNASLFLEPKTRMLTNVGTEIPCGGPFQPRYRNLNGRWIKTSPTLQLAATPIDVAELTEDWDEVMPPDDRELDFTIGGIYDRQAVLDIEEFLQTPGATTGVAISLACSPSTLFLVPWSLVTSSPSWRTSSGRSGASGQISLKSMEDQHQ
jgi:hypothetical protein